MDYKDYTDYANQLEAIIEQDPEIVLDNEFELYATYGFLYKEDPELIEIWEADAYNCMSFDIVRDVALWYDVDFDTANDLIVNDLEGDIKELNGYTFWQ